MRAHEQFPDATLFGTDPSWNDVIQGGAGTCYIMAAMGAMAEYPDVAKKTFETQTINSAGIYAIRFYIRGKPWLVTIDDSLYADSDDKLYFA